MFTIKTTHEVVSVDTRTADITRSTALRITRAPDYITDEALRERLFSAEYREELKDYMRMYGGYYDTLLSEEEISSRILTAEAE